MYRSEKRGRDGTKYSKFHPRGYLSRHLAAISMAAVYTDAVHIDDGYLLTLLTYLLLTASNKAS